MKFRIEVICVSENGTEERTKVTAIERQELAMETLGLNLAEEKSILEGLQDFGRRTALPVRSYAGGLGTAGAARRPDNGGNRWRLRPSSSQRRVVRSDRRQERRGISARGRGRDTAAKCFAVEHPNVVEARGTDVSTRLEQRSFVIRKSNSNSFRRVCENLTDSCESHTKR